MVLPDVTVVTAFGVVAPALLTYPVREAVTVYSSGLTPSKKAHPESSVYWTWLSTEPCERTMTPSTALPFASSTFTAMLPLLGS